MNCVGAADDESRKGGSQKGGVSKNTQLFSAVDTTKPTGTSFLPEETVERAKIGNPIEKAKIAKDPTNSWTDIYEYARKIREGELTWDEIEKADLDSVSSPPEYY